MALYLTSDSCTEDRDPLILSCEEMSVIHIKNIGPFIYLSIKTNLPFCFVHELGVFMEITDILDVKLSSVFKVRAMVLLQLSGKPQGKLYSFA